MRMRMNWWMVDVLGLGLCGYSGVCTEDFVVIVEVFEKV